MQSVCVFFSVYSPQVLAKRARHVLLLASNSFISTSIHTTPTLPSFQTRVTHVKKVRVIAVAKATWFSRGMPSQKPTLWGYGGSSSTSICARMCFTSKAPTQDFFATCARIAVLLAPARRR